MIGQGRGGQSVRGKTGQYRAGQGSRMQGRVVQPPAIMQLARVCPQAPLLLRSGRGAARAGAHGAGRDTAAPAQQCLHTHLARARTQITLIHFKPTLSPAALQQILLKACLHNGRAAQLAPTSSARRQ